MIYRMFTFNRPALAYAAVASLMFILVINVFPMDWVDKFSYQMGMGLAAYFLVVAGKAVRNQNKNLSALLFTVALLMIVIAIRFTSEGTLDSSALEDMSNPLTGGIGGFFTGVEDDE